MAKKSLLQTLSKHFTNTPAHILRPANFGKHIYLYFTQRFAPDAYSTYNDELFRDPAKALNVTREMFNKHPEIPDETVVDFMIDAISKADENLIDYEIIADLVSSEAYKAYGKNQGSEEFNKKNNFENWLINESTLPQIKSMNPVEVYLHHDALQTVADNVGNPGIRKNQRVEEIKKDLQNGLENYNEYVSYADENAYEKLKEIAANPGHDDYKTQLKKIFGVMFAKDENLGEVLFSNAIDASTNGVGAKMLANCMTTGWGLSVDEMLIAYCRTLGDESLFENIQPKFPIELRSEKFTAEQLITAHGAVGSINNQQKNLDVPFWQQVLSEKDENKQPEMGKIGLKDLKLSDEYYFCGVTIHRDGRKEKFINLDGDAKKFFLEMVKKLGMTNEDVIKLRDFAAEHKLSIKTVLTLMDSETSKTGLFAKLEEDIERGIHNSTRVLLTEAIKRKFGLDRESALIWADAMIDSGIDWKGGHSIIEKCQSLEELDTELANMMGTEANGTATQQQGTDTFEFEPLVLNEEAVNTDAEQTVDAEEVNNAQPDMNQPVDQKLYKYKAYPLIDCLKTFGTAAVGATAVSVIGKINPVVAASLGAAMAVGNGIWSGIQKYKAEKQRNNGKPLTKAQVAKIGLETGISMVGTATALINKNISSIWRVAGAAIVGAKTFFNDLERRADLQRTEIEKQARYEERTKDVKGFVANIKRIAADSYIGRLVTNLKEHRIGLKDIGKSAFYGLGKTAAVYFGGKTGREIGKNITVDTNQIKADFQEKVNDFKNLKNRLFATPEELQQQAENAYGNHALKGAGLASAAADEVLNSQNNFDLNSANNEDLPQETGYERLKREQFEAYEKYLHNQHLTDENLNRLDNLGKIELTDNARATAYVDNDRQYIGGEKHLWYTADEQKAIVDTLEKAGVDDPYGVLRKLGSAERFEVAGEIDKGGFQDTMSHLKAGILNNQDANNIYKALDIINEEGGLDNALGGNEQSVVHQNPVSMSHVGNDRFNDQVTETVKTEPKIDPVAVSDVGNDRFNGHTAESVIDNDVPTDTPAVEEQPRQSEPVATSRVDDGRIGAYAATALDDEVELGDNITTNENETVKLSSVSGDRFETGVKEAIMTNEAMENEPVEPVGTSRVDNDRFKSSATSPVNTDNGSVVDDVTALSSSAEIPTWNNDGSYAGTVYQDLVDKCSYSGTSVDGSYCFTDKDGTYYEINPVTHQMHIDRINVYGRVANVDIDLTSNQMIEAGLTEHAHAAEVISQNLAHSTGYSAEEIEALKLTKAAHEILANENSSFVDRQRATVQLEKLGAAMQDVETEKVDSVVESNNVVENSSSIIEETQNQSQSSSPLNETEQVTDLKPVEETSAVRKLYNDLLVQGEYKGKELSTKAANHIYKFVDKYGNFYEIDPEHNYVCINHTLSRTIDGYIEPYTGEKLDFLENARQLWEMQQQEEQGKKLFEFAQKDLERVKNIVKPGATTGLPNKNLIINVPNIYGWDL